MRGTSTAFGLANMEDGITIPVLVIRKIIAQ